MRRDANTIWDTGIQNVCGIVLAKLDEDVELWFCANFSTVTVDPQRVIVNPNGLYPILDAIRQSRRFSLNTLAVGQEDVAGRAIRVRYRAPGKCDILGLRVSEHEGVPYLADFAQSLVCDVESILDTGDHTVTIGLVRHRAVNPCLAGQPALLYPSVRSQKQPLGVRLARGLLRVSGVEQYARRRAMARSESKPDLAQETYAQGGVTPEQIERAAVYSRSDRSRVLRFPQPAKPLERRVSVCVIGVGQWGAFHCELFRQADPKVDLSVCGRNAAKVERLAARYGARPIIGMEQALADPTIEAVSLVLPHHLHAAAAEQAAAAGKRILLEKPIGRTLQESDAVLEACRRFQAPLMIAENMHFRPQLKTAMRAIDEGHIGEPLYFVAQAGGRVSISGWKASSEEMGGGVLMDLGVHYFRALRLIMGEPDRILVSRAAQSNLRMEGDDSVVALCESRFGWSSSLLLNWAGPRAPGPDITVHGTQGTLQIWGGANHVILDPSQPTPWQELFSLARPAALQKRLLRFTSNRQLLPVDGPDFIGYHAQVREFVASVAEGRAPQSTGEEARRDVEIVVRGYDSLAQKQWVTLPPL